MMLPPYRSHPPGLLGRLLVVAALLALSACGGHGQTSRTLTVLTEGDVDSLDPGITYSQLGYMIQAATQRTLFVYRNSEAAPAPDLAAAPADISRDGRVIRVRLRSGQLFAPPSGREIHAADIKYALERAFTPAVANGYVRTYFGDLLGVGRFVSRRARGITGITTRGRYGLTFRFRAPVAALAAEALAMPVTTPVPPEYARALDRRTPSSYGVSAISSGPFMLRRKGDIVTGDRAGRGLVLVRNPNWPYWRRGNRRRPEVIEVREGYQPAVAAARVLDGPNMLSGDFLIPPAFVKAHRDDARLSRTPTPAVGYVALNTRRPPFASLDARRAVAAVLNRRRLLEIVGGAARGTLASHFIPPGVPGFALAGGQRGGEWPFLSQPEGNLRTARRYWARAVAGTGQLAHRSPVLVAARTDPTSRRVAESVAADLRSLGIASRTRLLAPESINRLCGTAATEADVCADAGWLADFSDPQAVLDAPFDGRTITATGNPNLSLFDDPSVNRAIREAEKTVDARQRVRAWARVDSLVTAAVPAIPWLWSASLNIRSGNVRARVNPASGRWDLASAQLK